ncbi:MAG: DUF4924 family protein [Bacteroidaceae bacterium]
MFISRELKEKNIAEYLIYMWQVEDIIRANNCDIDKISSSVISPYGISEEAKQELAEWYTNLINMMRTEGVIEKGHLQINENVIINLTDLHLRLLHSAKQPFYSTFYYKALPYIVELRNKSNKKDEPEIETCFEALYGVMLLKLQKKELNADTQIAISTLTNLLSMLSDYYDKDKKGELKLED